MSENKDIHIDKISITPTANPSPAAAPAKSRIEDQIMDLETQF